ncbi:DNA adenine methylase [Campylobacter sp. MIT 99-7217]|nr:DNA adenine methylase [Campylobacter sp. MIT 99-7217]
MPAHERYVEVFGGALSVLYQKSKSKQEIINDINDELINLHKVIQTKPLSLMNALQNLLISRKLFEWIKNKQLSPRNDIEKAAFYYYLIAFSFASKGLHFSHTKVRASAIYKDFKPFSKRLKGVFIENKSFEYILKNYDDENTLFYLDPPYVNTEKYYQNTSVFGEHELLAELLKGVRGKFMLSYNDNELIRELYKGFFIKELELRYTLNNKNKGKMSKELLIMNFKP